MQPTITENTDLITHQTLRRIFKDWGSLKVLGAHTLSGLAIVTARHQAAGYTSSAAGRGLALRETLQMALDSLKPAEAPPQPEHKSWRPYLILSEQFIQGRSPEWVAAQMHVSKATYYSEQKRAFELLADVLRKAQEQHRIQTVGQNNLPSAAAPSQVPFLAPPRSPHPLIGRDNLISTLTQALTSAHGPVISALAGLPGVGKTTLAVEVAHAPEIMGHFYDGVLWAGLGRQPDILAQLGLWAAAVGAPAEVIAHGRTVAARAAAVHSAIGLRRLLLIIDDAWHIDDALPFKVGGPHCAYLLTSRLAGVALDFAGDKAISVQELDDDHGLNLLAALAPAVVAHEPAEIQKLVRAVGGLPLALVLVGGYLRRQSYAGQARRVTEALAYLQTSRARMGLARPHSPLEANFSAPHNTPVSLQATIGLNEAALDQRTRAALFNLAVFPPKPNSFSEQAALAVIEESVDVLDTLVDFGLVQAIAPDRYTLHQTIADYAGLHGTDPAAAARLVDYFTRFAQTNAQQHARLKPELTNLLAALELAHTNRLSALLIRAINALHLFLETYGLYQLDEQYLQHALAAAESISDRVDLLHNLGSLYVKTGQFTQAQWYLRQTVALARTNDLHAQEGRALIDLGLASWYREGVADNKNLFEQALRRFQTLNDGFSEGFALNCLGFACQELAEFDQAERYLYQAVEVSRLAHNRRAKGWAHFNLGTVYLPLGDFEQAETQFTLCRHIYTELGDRRGLGWLIYNLGRLQRQMGQYALSQSSFEQALTILTEIGDHFGRGFTLHNLGLLAAETGRDTAALTYYDEALQLSRQVASRLVEGVAYHSLGVWHRRCGNVAQAKNYLEQSLAMRRQVNYPRGLALTMANLGLVHSRENSFQTAQHFCDQAVSLAQTMAARPTLAYALTCLGHVLNRAGSPDKAAMAYQQAVDLRRRLGQTHWLADPLAGLAQAELAQGHLAAAQAHVDALTPYLESQAAAGPPYSLPGCDDPCRVYLTCYHVLEAARQPCNRHWLHIAAELLRHRAAGFEDPAQRAVFLENVPSHRELLSLWP